jgi:bifunctional DNA-binding transcriptional regulator/antitoxin component of YhaV-PrlF toxin-antitoxin module
MSDVTLDDRGRLTLPKEMRERYGDRYRVVELHDGIKLVPIADDPLAALREEFADIDKSAEELRDEAREAALEEAGH